jgi:predicted Ser/Thr protein kinase
MQSLAGQSIGEYRILELIGKGGMGEVYKARHTHLDRVIAIKALSTGLAGTPALERFYGEAGILARLKHPRIAEYLGFFEHGGRPCILMEYVDGESLAAILARRRDVPAREAVRWISEIADAAAYFHALGVVHRDLKSSNVKIDSAGRVKILDFGIARQQAGSRMTQAGAVVGTPYALAPEQLLGRAITPAVDIWQLGVLLYELLCGELPFQAGAPEEMYARILQAEPTPLRRVRPGVPPELERIVARCLRKNRAERYASALELLDALRGWEQGRSGATLLSWRGRGTALAAGALAFVAVLAGVALAVRSGTEAPAPAAATSSAPVAPAAVRTVTIDTADGPAQVLRDGKPAGVTPFRVTAPPGAKVSMTLQRPGFRDLDVEFEVTERREYTYTLQSSEER